MSAEKPSINITGFLWCVFATNMAYPILACLQGRLFGYPAKRHYSDKFSMAFIAFHMLTSGLVIWGGCGTWLAMRFQSPFPRVFIKPLLVQVWRTLQVTS